MGTVPFPAYGLERVDRGASQVWYEYLRLMERQFATFAPTLDPGIRRAVRVLYTHGIETCQSCQGNSFDYLKFRCDGKSSGDEHCYPDPTVEFIGGLSEGPKAFGLALAHGLRPSTLSRVWSVQERELTGPHWALTFVPGPQLYDDETVKETPA